VLGLTQTVPVFGAKGLERKSARAAATAAEAGAEQARNEALGDTWRAYADAYYAAELAKLADTHHAVIDRLVESARVRYEAGRGRLEDVLRTQAERATLGVDVTTFHAEAAGARARLDALRGVGVSEDTLASPPATAVPDSSAPWLAAIADSHPRLREARASI